MIAATASRPGPDDFARFALAGDARTREALAAFCRERIDRPPVMLAHLSDAFIGPDKAAIAWWQMMARGVIVFVAGLAMIRIAGARTFTRGSPLEIIVAVVVGSNLSRAMAGTTPFWPMLGVSALIVFLHGLVAQVVLRSRTLSFLVKRPPVALVRDGAPQRWSMRREGIDDEDLEASLREHGLARLDEVALATLERDGRISMVKRSGAVRAARRALGMLAGRGC